MNYQRFKSTRKKFPKLPKVKYSGITSQNGNSIFRDLKTQDFCFTETHISRKNARLLERDGRVNVYCEMVKKIIISLDPGMPHDIIIDSPPVNAIECLIKLYNELRGNGIVIEWFEVRPSSEDHILQVHDFITGAVGDVVEEIRDKERLYTMIQDKRIECRNSKEK